jgi:serine/threonine protein kinase
LAKVLKAKKMLSEGEAISVLKQIINGYKGIYRFGIIHRDLKPANIFFVNNKVKIADFGFAIKQGDIKKECNYNVGSPVYMPL